jgi:hypothetical protein
MTAAPIYAELREKAAAKQRAHDRKIFNEACSQLAAHMDDLGLVELYRSEVTKEIHQSWCRVWDRLNPGRTAESIEFKVKNATYWLTRDF